MKKLFLLLLLAFLLLTGSAKGYGKGISDLGTSAFHKLLEHRWARQVFDLDAEEAQAVFGETGEAYFL
ncbi:MAG: hypothetical protein IJC26_03675 [Clostridia bacterium]|nr:hypothetical protein [Clostridia bacterium]